MKKQNMKRVCIVAMQLLAIIATVFGLRWAWKYYGAPEWPDLHDYKTIEERAEQALTFARDHNMNEHYALFVDYSIPSGKPRLFVWDFQQKKIITTSYVMHGSGGGSTAECPRFSNRPGSECSTLGRFLVTKDRGSSIKRSFRLKGMDIDNQTAYGRGIMIHGAKWVDSWCWKKYIPLNRSCCQGCVTVSSKGMNYLWALINNEEKPLLLWNFCSDESRAKFI
ncbi:MAG: murein L,D-transpeptidase catalytic domain family protein [Prevotella sp.]|nr:murein L,D-transpeptidase catalytic domain family protein [Prevotella sp.]